MMILRPATQDDADFTLAIRNDPLTRANSRNTAEIPGEGHAEWLRGILLRADRRIYIATVDDAPIGSVRFDVDPTTRYCDMSWTVAADFRRRGYGTAMVAKAIGLVRNASDVLADIKDTNVPSQKIARANGFICNGHADDGFSQWRLGALVHDAVNLDRAAREIAG